MVLVIFVPERNGVVIHVESGIFVRSAEVDREGEGLGRGVVVVDPHVLDGAEVIVHISIDANADASLGLEGEGSAQSDDLGDLHGWSWIDGG